MPKSSENLHISFNWLLAVKVLAVNRYVLEGQVENVAYAISSGWPCYIAIDSPGSINSLKFHTTRNTAACDFAYKMQALKKPVKMIAEHYDTGSHQAVLIMGANTSATFYVDTFDNTIH